VRDVRAAGYAGCAKRTATKPLKNVLNSSTSLLWNFGIPVQGFNGTAGAWTPALTAPANTERLDSDGAGPDVDGPTPNTDVLVIRRVKPEVAGQRVKAAMGSGAADLQAWAPPNTIAAGNVVLAASCDGASVFQVSNYTVDTSTQTATIEHTTGGSLVPGNSSADIGNLFFADTAELVPVETVVYFVDTGTNGTSLYRRIGNASAEELIEGVDTLQVQFGVDTNGDASHLADQYVTSDSVTDWSRVVNVRVALLVRSMDEYGSQRDTATYPLLGETVAAFNDRRDRRVFMTTATLRNKLF
jgi:type IV pilus assembly protein PilW